MNDVNNLMTELQTKLIKFEDSLGKAMPEKVSEEELNERITEIRDFALKLPIIKKRIFDLNIKNLNCLTKEVQSIIGFIQLYFFPAHSFDEVDFECVWLCGTLISLLRTSRTRIIQLEFGSTAYKAIVEDDPVIYEWGLQLALAEILPGNKHNRLWIEKERISYESSKTLLKELCKEGIALLKNESDKLKHKTFSDMQFRYEQLEKTIIPQFEKLCNCYSKQVEEIKKSFNLSIGTTVSSLLMGCNNVKCEDKLVQEVVKTIQSLAQILSCNNRLLFSSLIKLSSISDYWSFYNQAFSLKIKSYISSFNAIPFAEAFELYSKFLTKMKHDYPSQKEYETLNQAICDHPEFDQATLRQILFIKIHAEEKMMELINAKGVFTYSDIKSLSFNKYASLFISAIRCNCTEVCKDLMSLKQYQLFSFDQDYFELVIRQSLYTKNIMVFQSFMKHPAFDGIDSEFQEECIERIKLILEEGEISGFEWRNISIDLYTQYVSHKT